MFTIEDSGEIMKKLKENFEDHKYSVKESTKKFKLQVHSSVKGAEVVSNIIVEKVDENVRCIRMEKVSGDRIEFLRVFTELKEELEADEMIL